ncbi:CAP domain containing protein [Trichuris trichiura]|uniref:CAP domain containing protein n=1 Tax=Trichuris trichiura TaxID=36087 RepID=A0A077YV57_TRITR|nr:CAP domain containing protein [Trichuris trichiura]
MMDQADFLSKHNDIRGRTEAQNIECMTGWSDALAAAAATQAARCNLTAPANDERGYSFHSSTTQLTVTEVLEAHWRVYSTAYNYMQGTCDTALATNEECVNALQMLWFEGGEFGCAREKCPNSYMTACAYQAKRYTDSRPFALLADLPPCVMCRSSYPICREKLCSAALVNLTRLYIDHLHKNILETSMAKIDEQVRLFGAKILGNIGKVPTATNTSQCHALQPITMYSRQLPPTTNFYAIGNLDEHWATSNGYTKGHTVGFAVHHNGTCGATVPVYTFYNDILGFVQLTDQSDKDYTTVRGLLKNPEKPNVIGLSCFSLKMEKNDLQTGWSDDLASKASAIAEICKTETPTTDTLGYMIHSSTAQMSPTNVLQEVWEVYANAYDYLTHTCNLNLTSTCSHTLQFLWFEGGQIGCARSECGGNTTQYLTVCAYPHRALPNMRPHTIAPPLPVCSLCGTAFPRCRDDLCCIDPTTVATNTTITTSPTTPESKECGQIPTSQLADFIRLYDKKENRNIFEIDQQVVSALVAKGVSNLGPAGRVAKALNSTACPFMQPIVVLRNDKRKKSIYTIDSTAITAANYHGYVRSGTMGYAVPGKDMCKATTGIYTFRHPCLGFVQLSNLTDVKKLLEDQKWQGYHWRGVEFYVW